MNNPFDYEVAFSRNIGWITQTEQQLLKTKRIAIAGLGGVGGSHLLTLTRLGIGRFNISDMDTFELANFNRQAGASLSHIGRAKVEVLKELALDINPELDIRAFPDGINHDNMDAFLEDVDLYIDGLDFFAVEARRSVFASCARKGIPSITAAPLGMGVSLLNFLPGKTTFEDYFQMEGQEEEEQLLRFLTGLTPAMLQMGYLVDDSRLDLNAHKGPSTPMACELCAGMAATQALKILLNRGKVLAVPKGMHFDAYRNKYVTTWRPRGSRNPLQALALKIGRKRLAEKSAATATKAVESHPDTPIGKILDLARWAPSGDNTQPWRFEIKDESNFLIHAHDTRDDCVYDLDGRASQTAVGALLETIAIAATGEGRKADFRLQPNTPETAPVIEVVLSEAPDATSSPLLPYIKARVTQRRGFSSQPLNQDTKTALEAAVAPGFRVIWIEGKKRKWQMAKLLFQNAQIRLTIPEAYQVHKQIIEWDAQFSTDRIPDQAVGLDPVALKLMRWAMVSWERVRMLNRYFAGTLMPRIQLDLLPALQCGAHFVLIADKPLGAIEDYLAGGRALQRFWLTATKLGLQFQPELTPLIFSRYQALSINFTQDRKAIQSAARLATRLKALADQQDIEQMVFIGRVGIGKTPAARSLRQPLKYLCNIN